MPLIPFRSRAIRLSLVAACLALVAACTSDAITVTRNEPRSFVPWTSEPEVYRLAAGDEFEVKLPFHGEFNDRVTVGPDGRVTLPLVGETMAAGHTVAELTGELDRRYAKDLRDPRVQVAVRSYASQVVFVGGEVNNPGLYHIPARVGIAEAVLMANGFKSTARAGEVVLIRRRSDGKPMLRTVDVAKFIGSGEEDVPLHGADIVYVPRSSIAEVDLFIEQFINKVVPFYQNFNYTVVGSGGVTTVR